MKINLFSLSEGAKSAKGLTVIIDVYRAFTTQSFAFDRGVNSILNVAETSNALSLKEQGNGDYCMGEIGGKRPKDFDFGNSPYDLRNIDLKNKTLIHCTMNGTTGAELAKNADLILGGALINAESTANYIKSLDPTEVSLVSMGSRDTENNERRTEEDELCAIYIKSILEESYLDEHSVVKMIEDCKESKKFGDPLQPHYPEFDKRQALKINEFKSPIIIKQTNGILVSKII